MTDFHYQYYSDGKWTSISNPLKGYTASQYGFDTSNYTKGLECFGLSLSIYARSSSPTTFPYKFYCQLRFTPVDCYIWVTDLPELFSLLKDLSVTRPIPYMDMLVDKVSDAFMSRAELQVRLVQDD